MSPTTSTTKLSTPQLASALQHERPPHLSHPSALDTVLSIVTCPQCSKLFRDPVTLICGWTVCKACLSQLIAENPNFSCPWVQRSDKESVSPCWTPERSVVRDVTVQRIVDWYTKQSAVSEDNPPSPSIPVPVKRKHELPRSSVSSLTSICHEKRLRHSASAESLPSEHTTVVVQNKVALLVADALGDCQICCEPYTQPTTTPCGHTFCCTCLQRTLDHTPLCPICRTPTSVQPFMHDPTTWTTKQRTTVHVPPSDLRTIAAPAQLLSLLRMDSEPHVPVTPNDMTVPVFVCGMVMPGQSYPLHIFEPRYRLMLRRILTQPTTSYNRLAMCMHNPGKSYAQVGTWLDIHSVEWLQDGRAIVDAVASDRFQIVEPLGLVDGYQMAVVQNLKDDDSNESLSTLLETCRDLYKFFDGIFERTSERLQDQVLHAYGPCPLDFKDYSRDDVYRFSFWVASVFPVAVEDKHRVLCATSIRSRLDLVSGWTLRIQQEWWYKRGGCTLM